MSSEKRVIVSTPFKDAVNVLDELERSVIVEGMLRAIARGAELHREIVTQHMVSLKEAKPGDRILRTRTIEFDDGTAFSVWFEYRGEANLVIIGADRQHVTH